MDAALHPHPNENSEFEAVQFRLAFAIGQNIRYNHKRSAFFQFWANVNKITAYVIGSATIVSLLANQYQLIAVMLNAVVLLLNAMDSFIDFGGKARDYKEHYQAYKSLEIALKQAQSQIELEKVELQMYEIEKHEPNTLNVLMAICWNEEALYQGYHSTDLQQIGWCQRLVAQYLDLCPESIAIRTEKRTKKK